MKKELIIGLICSLIFVSLFLRDVILNVNKPLANDGDLAFSYFTLQNGFEKFSNLDLGNLFDTRMFYPHKNSLTFGNSELPQALIGLPAYLLTKNIFISAHFVFIVNFFLSFLAMYLLAYKLTKSIGGSAVAGLIYNYNPYVFSHFPYHVELSTLQWIPLIFLFTEKLLDKVTLKRSITFAILGVVQLASSAYYAFFLAVLLPIYITLRLRAEKLSPKIFFNRKLIVACIIMTMLGGAYMAPYMLAKSQFNLSNPLEYVTSLSAHLSDFLFTTPTNLVYGNLNKNLLLQSLRDPDVVIHYTEHSFFPGTVPFILLVVSLWFLIRRRYQDVDRRVIITYLLLLLVSLVLMFGPYLKIGEVQMPAPYLLLYKFVPFANGLTVPSRFVVIVFLSLSAVSAFGWKYGSEHLKIRKQLILLVIILSLITLEYWQKPIQAYEIDPEIKAFYTFLDNQENIRVIAEIPMANGFPDDFRGGRGLSADSLYLFYGLYHHKDMINGYNSFISQDSIKLGVALMNFPSKNNLELLKRNGVDTVIVHTDEYLDSSAGKEVLNTLKKLGTKYLYSAGFIHAFSID